MCGIAAIIETTGRAVEPAVLRRMTASLAHRGPDDDGFYFAPGIGLGFRRLAIIDLSYAGHQPMAFEEERLHIVFNGEIYNYLELREKLAGLGHRFKSASDTEVILHAYAEWGTGCVSQFNGMWGFCIWDERRRKVFCSRDRMGVKPLYYIWDGRRLVIASEIKAILTALPGKPHLNKFAGFDFLLRGLSDHTADTFFADVQQLLPGHSLILKLDEPKLEFHCYWQIPSEEAHDVTDTQDAVERFAGLFQDAVRLRLRADVPVGSCLSGGLDSSSIVCTVNAIMRSELGWRGQKIKAQQKTFSADFEDHRVSEKRYMDLVLAQTASEGSFVTPTLEGLWSELPRVVYHQEAPFATTSVYSQWSTMRLAASTGVKVVLDGQGADELLGGYTVYLGVRLIDLLRSGRFDLFCRSFFGTLARTDLGLKGVSRVLARAWLKSASSYWQLGVRNRCRSSLKWLRKDTWIEEIRQAHPPAPTPRGLRETLRADLSIYNLPALLRYEDRNSMAFSIETRLPFLDFRLVEFAATLPDHLRIDRGETKVVLRRAMKNRIPEAISQRRDKKGFVTPQQSWLEASRERLQVFWANGCLCRPLTEPAKMLARLREAQPLTADESTELWRFISFEQWLRTFDVGL